jgi:hypothetical protein
MSLSHDQMLQLMALADGELVGDERGRAEGLVASSAEAREVFGEMRAGRVGPWLAALDEERAASGAGAGLADSVMAQVSELSPARGAQVSSLDEARSRRARGVVAIAVAAVALAAGFAVLMRPAGPGVPEIASGPSPVGSLLPSPLAAMTSVEVNEVDVPSRGVSVFEIPVAGAMSKTASSVVVWIDDSEEPGSP